MPYSSEWVEPELLLEHNGVEVWCTYADGDVTTDVRTYWFTLNERCGEDECNCNGVECRNVFDVRSLAGFNELKKFRDFMEEDAEIRKTIIAAIDAGVLTTEGINHTKENPNAPKASEHDQATPG